MNNIPRLPFCHGLLLVCILWASCQATPYAAQPPSIWEKSVVSLDVARKQYDYLVPWNKRMENCHKHGVVIGKNEILTTAEFLNDATLVQVQKNGRGKWWDGRIQWIDYFANLAVVTVPQDGFWQGMEPAEWATTLPMQGSARIVRWSSGNLQMRKAEINRLIVKRGKLSFLDHLQMDLDSEINSAGWAEIVTDDKSVLGLTSAQNGNNCTVIPAPFIQWMLQARQEPVYRGLGYFDFVWQKSENPALHQFLGRGGEPRGVVIIDNLATNTSSIKPKDLLLKIDSFEINSEGYYQDPEYGMLSLENLSTRQKLAGDQVKLTVWREGREINIDYRLPKADYHVELIPAATYDKDPEYIMHGGLVFQPLTEPFLQSWGAEWRRKAPFRLTYYTQEKCTPERPSRVILSMVFPDPCTLGYQDYRFLTVDQANGRKISTLGDLWSALKQSKTEFHVIDFTAADSIKRLVLDVNEAQTATRRIMQRYGLDKDHVMNETAPDEQR